MREETERGRERERARETVPFSCIVFLGYSSTGNNLSGLEYGDFFTSVPSSRISSFSCCSLESNK